MYFPDLPLVSTMDKQGLQLCWWKLSKDSAVPIRREPEKREVSVALENVFRSAIIELIISSKQTDRCHFPSSSIHLTTAAVTLHWALFHLTITLRWLISLHFVQQPFFVIVLIEDEIIFILWFFFIAGFWFLITLIIIINCQLLLARLGALFVMIQRGAFYFQLAECQSVTSVLQHDFKCNRRTIFL